MKSAADAYDLFHHELWRWGIIQHTERGWYHMDAEAQHVMRCENIQPDTWIVPPRMTSFAAMGQMAETEVWRAGETTARGNLLRGEDNFATFRGKAVYEIKPYQLDVDGRVVDPLNRSRMIGDFFVVPCFDIVRDGDGPQYPKHGRGRTQVYCCESDAFETFSWPDVIAQSEFYNAPLNDLCDQSNQAACAFADTWVRGWRDQKEGVYLPFMGEPTAGRHELSSSKFHGSGKLSQSKQQAPKKSGARMGPYAPAANRKSANNLYKAMLSGIKIKYNLQDTKILPIRQLLHEPMQRAMQSKRCQWCQNGPCYA